MRKTDGHQKFSDLFDFLTHEKIAIEYMNDDIRCERSSSKKVNSVDISQKPENDIDDKNNLIVNLLEQQAASQKQMFEMMSKTLGNANSNSNINNNISRNHFKCWIHRTDNHAISDCNVFIQYSSSEKIAAVKERRARFAVYILDMGRDSA